MTDAAPVTTPRTAPARRRGAAAVQTLCIDVGGTGLKAAVVGADGTMATDRVRVEVEYPMAPSDLLDRLTALTTPLPVTTRTSVGFPGVVRRGVVLTAPHFVTAHGPGTRIDDALVAAWSGFDLATALQDRFGTPTRVINDADLQGLDVTTGSGIEMVVTLGTGLGTSILVDGVLAPHLELAHHPFRHDETYNEQLGDAARRRIGAKKWNRRVARAIGVLDALVRFDRLFIGGGNARHLTIPLDPKVSVIDANAGILGGVRLWSQPDAA